MRRAKGGQYAKAGRSGPSKSSSSATSGGASRGRKAQTNGNAKSKAKITKKVLPRSELDVYEDSDGEGQAAFYSHIDEEARPDLSSMDNATRRRFKTTTNEDYDAVSDEDDGADFGDEDEEIDEDEAFDEEDEAKYGELLGQIGQKKVENSKQKNQKASTKQVSLSESEAEEEEDGDSETGDLEADDDDDYKRLDEIFDELEEEADEDAEQSDRNQQDAAAYAKMLATVQGKKKPRKALDPTAEQFYPEGEFNLQPSVNNAALTLETLMGSLKDEVQYADVKRQLVHLQKTKNLLAQPLAQPIKQKLTREEAYSKKKEEITEKWEATVLENRKADHLKFPFAEAPAPRVTAASLANLKQPENELEKGIADILAQSGISKKDIDGIEGLEAKELNPDEIQERESQVQKMKAILFYEEMKAKRRKKIKSKAYHRILKKKKLKSALSLEELQQVDQEAAEKEAEKLERLRIQERITQRHKNKGKWAQRQLMRGHVDKETRQAISEQIKIRDQLLKKQHNLNDDDDEDVDDMDDEQLKQALEQLEHEEAPRVEKGLMGMDFMRRGMKRRAEVMREAKEQWEQEVDDMIRRSQIDSEDEAAEHKIEEEAEVRGRRTVNQQHNRESASEPVASVKFSGATQQTERAALSSGRTVKMTGHATIDVPAALKRGPTARVEPEISHIFSVEEFPETEESDKRTIRFGNVFEYREILIHAIASASVHDVNKNRIEVEALLKEGGQPKNKKAKTSATNQKIDQTSESPREAPQTNALGAPATSARPPAKHVPPDAMATSVLNSGDADEITHSEKAAKILRRAPSKPEAEDKENPWMKKAAAATGIVATKSAPPVSVVASHAATEDKVAKSQKKSALSKRQKAETTLKLEVEKLISDVAATQTRDHDDDRSNAEGRTAGSFNLLASATDEQKELIKRAFANDDVVEEFKADKQAELESDLPKQPKPTVMPGWGEWVGEGVVERKPKKPRVQKPKRPDELPAKPPTRNDDGLDHVIINQKRNKKAAKFLADQLPSLYRKQPELYEAQLQTPLGREWNTQRVYDRVTRPRLELKRGHMIKPISKPHAKKAEDEEEDKGEPVNKYSTRVASNKRKREPKAKQ